MPQLPNKGRKFTISTEDAFVTPKELAEALVMVAKSIKSLKENTKGETTQEVERIENRLNNLSEQIKRMIDSSEKRTAKDVQTLGETIKSISKDLEKNFNTKLASIILPDVSPFLTRTEYQNDRKNVVEEAVAAVVVPVITAITIRDDLETLTEDERLDKSAIKGLEEYDEKLIKLGERITLIPSGGGGSGGVSVFQDGTRVGSGASLNFIGATVTNTDGHTANIDLSGVGGITLQTDGVANGSQTLLNLVEGAGMTITDDGVGNITFESDGTIPAYFIDQTPDNGTYGLLSGAVNGSNTTFTVSQAEYSSGNLSVYRNGLMQLQGASDDWVETTPGSGTFDFNIAPLTGDIITVTYGALATPADGILLRTNGVNNGSQTLLDLVEGNGIILTDGGTGGVTIDADLTFQVNGAPTPTQTLLNLVAGTGITITDSGAGDVTFDVTGGSGPALETNGTPNGVQSLLNLVAGPGIALVDNGFGSVTIDATAALTTIYSGDGAISGSRVVDMAGNSLEFSDAGGGDRAGLYMGGLITTIGARPGGGFLDFTVDNSINKFIFTNGSVDITSGSLTLTSGSLNITSLGGSGTRMVTVDNAGDISAASIPGGTVTDFMFTDGNGFDGTVTTSTSTPTLSLTTSLTANSVPFIGASGAIQENTGAFIWNDTTERLSIGSTITTNAKLFVVLNEPPGYTVNNQVAVYGATSNGYDTTAGARISYGGFFSNNSYRSAGSNDLTNVGILVGAVSAQFNYALIASDGSSGFLTTTPTAHVHIGAGTATAGTAPLKLTSGTNNTTAEVGAVEYDNTFHVTNSDATRRHVVTAPNTTKVTAGAPYTNDGYIVVNIGGTDFKLMTTA